MEQNREPRRRSAYSQLIFDNGEKTIQWDKVFSTSSMGTAEHPHLKKEKKEKNLGTDSISFTKISSKWITDLKCRKQNYKTPTR